MNIIEFNCRKVFAKWTHTPHLHLFHIRRLVLSHSLLFITQTLKKKAHLWEECHWKSPAFFTSLPTRQKELQNKAGNIKSLRYIVIYTFPKFSCSWIFLVNCSLLKKETALNTTTFMQVCNKGKCVKQKGLFQPLIKEFRLFRSGCWSCSYKASVVFGRSSWQSKRFPLPLSYQSSVRTFANTSKLSHHLAFNTFLL